MENKETPASFSVDAVKHNLKALEYTRASVALFSGACSGILGLQNYSGFIFYVAVSVCLGLFLIPSLHRFPSKSYVLVNSALSHLSSYVLLWTLCYGLVHVYE